MYLKVEEYIERGALLDEINRNPAEPHNERCAQILEAILEAPTIEVEQVKHGFWVSISNDDKWGACSNCAHAVDMSQSRFKFAYCPHCGSKMDEKK